MKVEELYLQRLLQDELVKKQKQAIKGDSFEDILKSALTEMKEPTQAKEESLIDTLNKFIQDTNQMQKESAELTERFIKGEPVEIHDVMIAAEKAKTSFQLLLEIRNRFIDLYREILRMQM